MIVDYENLRSALAGAVPPPTRVGYRRCAVCLPLFERSETHVLLIQKADTEGYHWRNQVALPGGHVAAADRGITETALRELDEELGIHAEELEVLGCLGHFQTVTSQADLGVVVARWDGQRSPRFDPREISRLLEFPLDRLLAFHAGQGYAGRRAADIADALEYRAGDARIWGVTARILHFFLELMTAPGVTSARSGGPVSGIEP